MKKKILTLTAISIMALSACVKTPKPEIQPNESTNFSGMKIPASFDWKMTSNVVCNFTSATHASEISLSLKDSDIPFATYVVGTTAQPIKFSIPKTENSFVLQYLKADGLSAPITLNIVNGAVQYSVPSDSQQIIETKASNDQYTHYPTNGKYGTLMFEDLWPAKGDYDLNDFVANYKITLSGTPGRKTVGMIKVELRIVAIGGYEPFNFYMQLDKVRGIDLLDTNLEEKFVNTAEIPEIAFLTKGTSNPALISLKGIRKNLKGVSNNMKEHNLAVEDMINVSFTLYSDNVDGLDFDNLSEDDFNFFIAKEDGSRLKEVHLGGSTPSYLGMDLYNELKRSSSNINYSTDYYFSNEKLVWAIKVPKEIPHSIEGVDFTTAYPNFRAWAENGAANNNGWYNQPDKDNTISVKK